MQAIPNGPHDRRPSRTRRIGFDELMTLFAGPFVLAALIFSFVLLAFNVWPTFYRFSEWGD